ncbi:MULTISPECIES: hypothetical protein [unclassified Nostoc]|uniref:hypothetical protein n=1 Tax=unclassified Nostoc TaxID=2593658 RepID=UPI002AD51CC1|nr:hypothetical protein [Nostoc sp. DedQUE03]MDZ7975808.1 hypothetical protein [Nostoc sp. DedQUE03]MDZ8048341.1 hypothetical protein [Nostoc sp. DedQUE02]
MKLKLHLTNRNFILTILAFSGVALAFSVLIIKNLSEPLVGFGDTEQWEYAGFYLKNNISFKPFPHLDLINNQVFYPYGTSSVFQPWSIERDIFYAIFYSFFGIGPWIQIYYLLSVLLTGIGSFILLFKDYSFARASGAAFLISFFSFYAILKYPEHLSYSIFHWTALSLIADFLILKRVTSGQYVSLRLILLRACLLILSLGQELGYIAGCALTSFTISTIFAALFFSYRYFINKRQSLVSFIKNTAGNYKNEFFAHPRISLTLLGLCLISSFINLPLVFQIAREAKSFDFTEIPSGAWWANPLRILIPFLPFFHPGQVNLDQFFNDSPEGIGAGSPGWFLLIIASVGLWQGRKKIIIFIPLLIIFLLCLLYHPIRFPILKIFPWFAFSRVQGRFTVLYPIILSIFALNINLNPLRLYTRQLVSALLVFLACTEIFTAYSVKLNDWPFYSLDNNFFQYMNYVNKQPGEAVLDWPFCVVGGNGVGGNSLCPYFSKNMANSTLRRFHKKKVMGHYFGRLHTSQIQPYIDAGWDKLFAPDIQDIFQASHQKRCFSSDEWIFFTDFYKLNDFAGINLYVDFLPQNCVIDFYTHFGKPTVETKVPGAGLVKFIPKSSQLRNQVDLNLGSHLKFEPFLDLSEADLIKFQVPYGLNLKGLTLETHQGSIWRWGLSPETLLKFKLPNSKSVALAFSFMNPINGQDIFVEANGVTLDKLVNISKDTNIKRRLKFQSIPGWNTVVFKYKDWNNGKVTFAPDDERKMTVNFTQLAIEEE